MLFPQSDDGTKEGGRAWLWMEVPGNVPSGQGALAAVLTRG